MHVSLKAPSREKARRASAPDAPSMLASNGSAAADHLKRDPWQEVLRGRGPTFQAGIRDAIDPSGTLMSASDLLELHRRCVSCLHVVLQQQASLEGNDGRMMLAQQAAFNEHELMRAIKTRLRDQSYTDMKAFESDLMRLLDSSIAKHDLDNVVDILENHVRKTQQKDSKHPSKALFHGFPHPLLEEMMTMTAAARKRLPPSGTVHVNMDVGRHLARAYGVGLSRGARFCGEPSQEKAHHIQRRRSGGGNTKSFGCRMVAVVPPKTQKRSKEKDKGGDSTKKKQKSMSPASSSPAATAEETRRARANRRKVSEGKEGFRRALCSTPVQKASKKRHSKRAPVHCHHLQGEEIEMLDPDYPGHGFTGVIKGVKIVCNCGCGDMLSGTHWLMHNGGRSNNRHPGYPYKYMRVRQTGEQLIAHSQNCDASKELCDTCNSWEVPGATMASCWECNTCVHATEECALRVILIPSEPLGGGSTPTQPADGPPSTPACVDKDIPDTATSGPQGDQQEAVYLTGDKRAQGSAGANVVTDEGGGDGVVSPIASGKGRPRSCRKKDQLTVDSASACGSAVEGESGGANANSAGWSVSVPRTKKRETLASEEIVAWICQICSAGGREYPSSEA